MRKLSGKCVYHGYNFFFVYSTKLCFSLDYRKSQPAMRHLFIYSRFACVLGFNVIMKKPNLNVLDKWFSVPYSDNTHYKHYNILNKQPYSISV